VTVVHDAANTSASVAIALTTDMTRERRSLFRYPLSALRRRSAMASASLPL
jgi:hypothetical protein